MLTVSNLYAGYDRVPVIKNVSFSVNNGEALAITGKNGAGKTTLLKAIINLVKPYSGTVTLNGINITSKNTKEIIKMGVSYIPQDKGIFPYMTVKENILTALYVKGLGKDSYEYSLNLFPSLKPMIYRKANSLSGGEQRLLSLAIGLCYNPKLLLLDEPTESLMPSAVKMLKDRLVKMKEEGVTIILVEHNINLMSSLCNRILIMEDGMITYDGNLKEVFNENKLLKSI